MSATFTPGPWAIRVTNSGGGQAFSVDGNPQALAIAQDILSIADAHLIASAPCLLKALKTARGQIVAALISEYGPDVAVQSVAHIDAAIALATPTAEGVA